MKIMTLNINYYMTKHGTWSKRKEVIAQTIQEKAPDILLLQAVKQDPRVGGGIDQAAQLMVLLPDYSHYYFQPSTIYQDDSQDGSAIITRFPLIEVDHIPLTLLTGLEDPNRRFLLTALLETPSGPLRVFNAHFSWVNLQAELNIDEALSFTNAFPEPAVFGGDFNTTPEVDLLDRFRQDGWTDAWAGLHPDKPGYTFEAPEPTMRIDYIWANPKILKQLTSIEIVSSKEQDNHVRLSDHLGLMATFDY